MYGFVYSLFTGRDGRFPKLRREYLAEHPTCIACGTTKELEVHHKIPVHVWAEGELLKANFRTMCRTHHWEIGHCGKSWEWWNENVDEEAALHLDNINHARALWQKFEAA